VTRLSTIGAVGGQHEKAVKVYVMNSCIETEFRKALAFSLHKAKKEVYWQMTRRMKEVRRDAVRK
jgi:hypothetical protein